MDKPTTLTTINDMLGIQFKSTLMLSEKTRALMYECDCNQMHNVMREVYKAQDTSEEFVKKSVAKVMGETIRIVGFGAQKD